MNNCYQPITSKLIEPPNKGSNVYCGNCDKTDGMCYCSNPPKVKCTVTVEFHSDSDKCNCRNSVELVL